MSKPTAPAVQLPGGPAGNRSQDAYEELREALRGIEVYPAEMRVDWNTEEREAPIRIGRLRVVDVLRLTRALKNKSPVSGEELDLHADRPYKPMVGETVMDLAADRLGEVLPNEGNACLLRPLEGGEVWAAGHNDIRRPDRDRLIKARMGQLERNRHSRLPTELDPAAFERVSK